MNSFIHSPSQLIIRISRIISRLSEKRLEHLGFSVAQLPVLHALKDGKALTQKELIEIVGTEQASMAEMLSRMERNGLILRQLDISDRRRSLITLTPLAIKKIPSAIEIYNQGNIEILQGLTEQEQVIFLTLLVKVNSNLQAIENKNI